MSDEQPPSSYAPFIALAVVLVLEVLALVGVLVTALIVFVIVQAGPTPAATSSDVKRAAPLNRLAVIADDHIYTIDPDGSHRIDLAHNGSVPTAAVIWSHDGQRLIFVAEADRVLLVHQHERAHRLALFAFERDRDRVRAVEAERLSDSLHKNGFGFGDFSILPNKEE